ncbi:hypothetical protein CISG_03026 [Coccidioides immitis RMSCC 3703]|uniref:Uncharacterized protein n=1 Tax=Coccidioides immitis RMSCC 3703 TaxID=454286 RepID=A0A0J8QME4_COCIT|nr:hypothetical protein CISG_03026 [Coccidioides immitis RMSCC 3703]
MDASGSDSASVSESESELRNSQFGENSGNGSSNVMRILGESGPNDVRGVCEEVEELEGPEFLDSADDALAVAEVNEESRLGSWSSGVMVVKSVSHESCISSSSARDYALDLRITT